MWLYVWVVMGIFFGCLGVGFLFAPIRIEIDTRENLYRFRVVPFIGVRWVTGNGTGYMELEVVGIHGKLSGRSQRAVGNGRQKKQVGSPVGFRRIGAVMRSFKVKKWFVSVDTGDMAVNGRLFPVLYMFGLFTGKPTRINFYGLNVVAVTVESNLFRILRMLAS